MSMIALRARDIPDSDVPPSSEEIEQIPWAGRFSTEGSQYWESTERDDTVRVWLLPSGRWAKTAYGWNCYITDDEARVWLSKHEYRDAVREHIDREHDGPGRPGIGPEVKFRVPLAVRDEVDRLARVNGVTRADELRAIVTDAIYFTA